MPDEPRQNLYVYSGGFLTQPRIRRILTLAGFDIRLGAPGPQDNVGVWGQSPTAPRGEAVARHKGAGLIRVEDSFLRSVRPGRSGDLPIGLNIDRRGVHFDPATPSDLEMILAHDPLDDTVLLNRAKAGISALQAEHLSKYSCFDPATPVPDAGYVLVIDQTRMDASITASGADSNTFREMLFFAQTEHPSQRIVIKTHPETMTGDKAGYFTAADTSDRISLCAAPVSPWALLAGAVAVYTVTSQLGFEAILAGHKPVVFGQPFYAGWGLSDDRKPLPRRQRRLTRAQLFAGAMILYPTWYDPYHDRLCSFEEATATQSALTRAWRDDHQGWVAADMRLWKRSPLQQFFGQYAQVRFARGAKAAPQAEQTNRRLMRWASTDARDAVLVEDGFVRSRGLGADLVAPLSLVLDDLGIYYDATRPSRLEALIAGSTTLPATARDRAAALIKRIRAAGLSKYNLQGTPLPDLPKGRRILVPGQVEDDASIRLGAGAVRSNAALLQAVRAANPAAVIIYKPHPDVRANLRPGHISNARDWADLVLEDADPIAAIQACDCVWTMTSLLGFEALLHDRPVSCLGMPFYAGWGLTDDRTMPLSRRNKTLDLTALVHAALIAYPRYRDPVSGLPCPVEVIVDRLTHGDIPPATRLNRATAKLQGLFASAAPLWR
ncbi:capsular polysaccharide biosynthesis protein [Yoonia vestfoldensis]|uniref:Capsular polysaccharide export protein KpsC n=1 Tax=Yoonia vestfoldensis SKA53 TaxID=314232 RepID=A3V3R3_9RHOB|nr:capsular polysaccharide biosynthesis protein [Yoonia vestfoldensis]EAQ07120.1 capsular polysaccharide export protein KpsC [Yoonia vestfoldensis SKA53]